MKIRTQLLLLAVICLSISCRKDDPIFLPEPNGNVLILEVDASFSIMGGSELWVDNLTVNDGILELETISTTDRWTIVVTGSNDTIFDLTNDQLTKPMLSEIPNLKLTDDRLYNSIFASDLVALTEHKFDSTAIILQLGNVNLIHSYLSKNKPSKLTFLQLVSQRFDPELGLTYPVIRRYFLVGYEK